MYLLAKSNKLIDPHIHGIYEWRGINKNNMYLINKIFPKKNKNFYHIIFDQNYHHYFYGTKVIDLEYDLKYRAIRRYPKNIADLILVSLKTKFKIPKVDKLSDNIKIEAGNNKFNVYSKDQFLVMVQKYLIKNKINLEINDIKKLKIF